MVKNTGKGTTGTKKAVVAGPETPGIFNIHGWADNVGDVDSYASLVLDAIDRAIPGTSKRGRTIRLEERGVMYSVHSAQLPGERGIVTIGWFDPKTGKAHSTAYFPGSEGSERRGVSSPKEYSAKASQALSWKGAYSVEGQYTTLFEEFDRSNLDLDSELMGRGAIGVSGYSGMVPTDDMTFLSKETQQGIGVTAIVSKDRHRNSVEVSIILNGKTGSETMRNSPPNAPRKEFPIFGQYVTALRNVGVSNVSLEEHYIRKSGDRTFHDGYRRADI